MNFKDEYRAANEQIHGDRTILAGINEKPKKIIYFKPAVGVGIAAAVCAVTLLAYPYINLPRGNVESPEENIVFLASEQEQGMSIPTYGEEDSVLTMRKAAPPTVAEPSSEQIEETVAVENSQMVNAEKATIVRYAFAEDFSAVLGYDENQTEFWYTITEETVFVNKKGEEISREQAKKGGIAQVETQNDVALKIIIE